MWTLFSISLGRGKPEFSVVGIADVGHNSVKFQGLRNGEVIVQGEDYEMVRAKVLDAVRLNKGEASGLQ